MIFCPLIKFQLFYKCAFTMTGCIALTGAFLCAGWVADAPCDGMHSNQRQSELVSTQSEAYKCHWLAQPSSGNFFGYGILYEQQPHQ